MGSFLIVPFVLGKERSFHQELAQPYSKLDLSDNNAVLNAILKAVLSLLSQNDDEEAS